MKTKLTTLLFFLLFGVGELNAQVLSLFTWEQGTVGTDLYMADVGPNAVFWGSEARRRQTGNGGGWGLGAGKLFGALNQDIDFTVPGTVARIFDVSSIQLSIDFIRRLNEVSCNLFVRGESVRLGFDGGILYIGYRVKDGAGGFVQIGSTNSGNNGFSGAAGRTVIQQGCPGGACIWRTYRFEYDSIVGRGTVYLFNTPYWTSDGISPNGGGAPLTPGKGLYWAGAPNTFIIGQRCDAMGDMVNPTLDNAQIFTPIILPITLTYFEGEKSDSRAILRWESSSEMNNDFYTIFRTRPGEGPDVLGTIKGAGTTNSPTQYTFVDPNPRWGDNEYMLQQQDIDGNFKLLDRIVLNFSDFNNRVLEVFPSPVREGNVMNLRYESNQEMDLSLSVYNLEGKLIQSFSKSVEAGVSTTEIDVSGLKAGMYFLKVNDGSRSSMQKFIVIN